MARIFGIIISIVSLLLCSCCKLQHEQGSLKPEWSAQIPTFESPEIFYPGILNLPKSGGIMVLPTTIYDGGFMWEDNRLCGMDLKTGKVQWYFPSDLDNRRYCHFDSKGSWFFSMRPIIMKTSSCIPLSVWICRQDPFCGKRTIRSHHQIDQLLEVGKIAILSRTVVGFAG